MSGKSRPAINRFIEKIKKESGPKGECWEWLAKKDTGGYGMFTVKNGEPEKRAHRFSYEHFIGSIQEGNIIRHKCDNRSCVNPDHLISGTHKENTEDKEARGRGNHVYGVNHPSSIRTTELIKEIREAALKGGGIVNKSELSRTFGVSRQTISRSLEEDWEDAETNIFVDSDYHLPYSQLVNPTGTIELICPNPNCERKGKPFTENLATYRNRIISLGNTNLFCTNKCYLEFIGNKSENLLEFRFWSRVQKENENDPNTCWIWTGVIQKDRSEEPSSGILMYKGKTLRATRLSWKIAFGEDPPKDIYMLQKCLNKQCVSPSHLYLGDKRESARLKKLAGTAGSKMTLHKAAKVRILYNEGMPVTKIAKLMNVVVSCITNVINNKSWTNEEYERQTERNLQKGGKRYNSVLNEEQVVLFKKLKFLGYGSVEAAKIAQFSNINLCHNIAKERAWSHVKVSIEDITEEEKTLYNKYQKRGK